MDTVNKRIDALHRECTSALKLYDDISTHQESVSLEFLQAEGMLRQLAAAITVEAEGMLRQLAIRLDPRYTAPTKGVRPQSAYASSSPTKRPSDAEKPPALGDAQYKELRRSVYGLFERQMFWQKKKEEKLELIRNSMDPRPKNLRKYAQTASQQRKRALARESLYAHILNGRSSVEEMVAPDPLQDMEQIRLSAAEDVREPWDGMSPPKSGRQKKTMETIQAERAVLRMRWSKAISRIGIEKRNRERKVVKAQVQTLLDKQEVEDTFGEHGLIHFPQKMMFRIRDDFFYDKSVQNEYRVRDAHTRGVSYLMGRRVDNWNVERQCILFDRRFFTEIEAARWWQQNEDYVYSH